MKTLAQVYPWLLLSPAVLPVIVCGELIYPYLVPKTLLMYALTFVTFGAFVLLVAHGHTFFWKRLRAWRNWIPALLLTLAYVTSYFGIGFYHSFWSLYIRGDGLLMLSCVTLSFYLVLLYATRSWYVQLVQTVAVIGSLIALYGIGEHLIDGGRIGSLLGNAAFFAGYLGLSLFATLIAASSLHKPWRNAAYAGALLQGIAIVLTATRGTILALFVAGVCGLVFMAFIRKGRVRSIAIGILGALILIVGAFISFRGVLSTVPFEPISRIASISRTDPDVASRLYVWSNMLEEIKKAPFAGVGAEHIDVLFNRYYDPTLIHEQWFDRSHNAYLDYAIQFGIGGLLLYLALLSVFGFAIVGMYRKGNAREAVLLGLLLVTYAVQNFFVFDTVSSFWFLLVLIACTLALSKRGEETPARARIETWMRPVSYCVAAVSLLLVIPVAWFPALAAYDQAQAYKYQIVDVEKTNAYLSHGFALNTYGDLEFGYLAYDMYAHHQVFSLDREQLLRAFAVTQSLLTQNFKRYPYDARTALYLSHLLSIAPQGAAIDTDLRTQALERALRESPKRSQPWYVLVNLQLTQANAHPPGSKERLAGYAAASDLLSQYLKLVPKLAEPHFVLAEIARASGDTMGAAVESALGKTNYAGDVETARRAVGYYLGAKEVSPADLIDGAYFLGEVVRLAPEDDAARYDLAKAQFLLGKKEDALVIMQDLRARKPELVATDQAFLAAITSYEQSRK